MSAIPLTTMEVTVMDMDTTVGVIMEGTVGGIMEVGTVTGDTITPAQSPFIIVDTVMVTTEDMVMEDMDTTKS